MEHIGTEGIDVVILSGGLGKRLQSVVEDRPKPMAEIGGRPFLDILIDYLAGAGFRRCILCIGYMGDFIKRYYQNRKGLLQIIFSEEKAPLGTAGAIKNAERFTSTSPFLVVNGDSYCDVDLKRFLGFHLETKALASIVLTSIEDAGDYGNVTLGEQQRIINFAEKAGCQKGGFISAGIYLFQREILSLIPANQKYSLEEELFPAIVNKEFYGYIGEKALIDIGTPQRYRKADRLLGT